jgi:hypothetical protein
MLRESRISAHVPWPLAPRPFDDEAFGSWLGRVAAKYRISVGALWEMSVDESCPRFENVGWILFPRIGQITLDRLSMLARLDGNKLSRIQTPTQWITPRHRLPHCFKCLVLNDADVSASRWKREWLDPAERYCRVHYSALETVPANLFNTSPNFTGALRAISGYRARCKHRALWQPR